MKTPVALILLTSLLALPLCAQTPSPSPVSGAAVKLTDLPEADQAKYNAAKKEAYKVDPTLKQKFQDRAKALREAMIKADPSVEPIINKLKPPTGSGEATLADLPTDEQAKYNAARKAAYKVDPTIKQKFVESDQAMRAAMIKADPSVEPILNKLKPPTK